MIRGGEKILLTGWISIQKLSILGVRKEYTYMALFLIGIMAVYAVLRPLIQFLLLKHSHKLLTYLISSLFLLVMLLFTVLMQDGRHDVSFVPFMKYAMLTFAVFGFVLLIMNILHFFLQKNHSRHM